MVKRFDLDWEYKLDNGRLPAKSDDEGRLLNGEEVGVR